MTAWNVLAVLNEVERAQQRFGLPESTRVVSCYGAGRDGFWLHRCLVHHGLENLVVDSSSIEVKRRSRRAKTDRLDVGKLLTMLLRHDGGSRRSSISKSLNMLFPSAYRSNRSCRRERGTVLRSRFESVVADAWVRSVG